ncbi:hypothetical protein [Mesorhizobium australafricanum]|uniref:Uncharacterized protein n=1 Tax=Mesorhizobium australafricanum TaxID=3072311 RepID=A0ABU4X0K7_9HYPH|nr:hypothetical protein [Mesorhizobium sp. VK3E]MDX8441852.1 hypothetical protein [Mesorhizobium sp. VK3E]
MDKTTLVEADINAGHVVIMALEAAGLPVAAAMWLKLREINKWELYIASPDVERHGPTTVIRFIDQVLITIKSEIAISNIIVTNTTNHFVNLLSKDYTPTLRLAKHASSTGFLRMNDFTLGGVEIDSGLVYKIAPHVRASKTAPKANNEAMKKAKALAA